MNCGCSSMMLRRFYCCGSISSSGSIPSRKKPLVFLGSPQVSVTVLDALFNASKAPDSLFEVAAVVTQSAAARDRGRKVLPSPVAQYALDRGFPSDHIYTPERAGEVKCRIHPLRYPFNSFDFIHLVHPSLHLCYLSQMTVVSW
uniref:Uncharacterized protein n=1 Tax=Kalanchoe fedtschenkoi TaxID=63787 RepID=A0A7N0V9P1_KALFE